MIQSNRERVYQAIVDYCNVNQRAIGRKRLAQVTGLSLPQLDEHIKTLKEGGVIHAPETQGFYEPVAQHPPARAITVSVLPDGLVKHEWGDKEEIWTPHEWAVLGQLASGAARGLSDRNDDRHVNARIEALQRQLKDAANRLADMATLVARLTRAAQPDLFEGKRKETAQ